MKLFKGGLVAAVLAVLTLGLASSSALADPIGAPYYATGEITLDGGLGGSICTDSSIEGWFDGTSVDDIVFGGCRGAAGTPIGNTPWPVTWTSATDGYVEVDATAVVFGIITCHYKGRVQVSYDAGPPPSITLSGTVPNDPRNVLCPAEVDVSGRFSL